MRAMVVTLLAVPLLAAAQNAPPAPVVRRWIDAVLAHQPGETDQPLRDMAATPPEVFRTVALDLQKPLQKEFPNDALRNDIRRRGALLHLDLVLAYPDRVIPSLVPLASASSLRDLDAAQRSQPGALIY